MALPVPDHVRGVCTKLQAAGHEAVTVGGAVRDALLGVAPGDWDVATSALPEQVLALFSHVIPTGLQHGTVTVVTGRGEHTHVEVTTYRGEGAYSDARRPDAVHFGVPLREDLARRDLTVNAIAYDPASERLIDPFGGQADLARHRLRAVGDPVARFTEDGLRVMRAVRFAARLEFELDADTEAAIAPALPSLAKVSRERVADELRKLLAARQPSRGLAIARRTGIVRTVLPELDAAISDEPRWLARVDSVDEAVRLAALFVPVGERKAAERIARGLKLSNAEIDLAAQLVGAWGATREHAWTPASVRRQLSQLARDKRSAAAELWATDAPRLGELARQVLAARDPLDAGALAVTGGDLIDELELAPGPQIGKIIAALLAEVIEDPARNTREQLIARAKELAA